MKRKFFLFSCLANRSLTGHGRDDVASLLLVGNGHTTDTIPSSVTTQSTVTVTAKDNRRVVTAAAWYYTVGMTLIYGIYM